MKTNRTSRGLRNLNPGNIRRSKVRYRGERVESSDPEFRQFESIEAGYRAMFVLLHTYATRHDCTTLRRIISRYAPPSENNTEGYIRRVAAITGLDPDATLDTRSQRTMVDVVRAMSEVENGVPAVESEVLGGWRLFAADFCK